MPAHARTGVSSPSWSCGRPPASLCRGLAEASLSLLRTRRVGAAAPPSGKLSIECVRACAGVGGGPAGIHPCSQPAALDSPRSCAPPAPGTAHPPIGVLMVVARGARQGRGRSPLECFQRAARVALSRTGSSPLQRAGSPSSVSYGSRGALPRRNAAPVGVAAELPTPLAGLSRYATGPERPCVLLTLTFQCATQDHWALRDGLRAAGISLHGRTECAPWLSLTRSGRCDAIRCAREVCLAVNEGA